METQSITAPTPAASAAARVAELLTTWRRETAHLSASTKLTAHPAYQALIELGEPALPALFSDLERTRDGHLAKALAGITGANPVPPEHRGRIREIAEDWLAWARGHGYQW